MNRVARWLVVLTALLATSACMDTHLHCEVPSLRLSLSRE
jgi:hypothetical protein